MNATPPVLPAFIPDAGAATAATAAQSAPNKADRPTFAGTLKDVGAKSGRKAVTPGRSVPAAGNITPPPAASPPVSAAPIITTLGVPSADLAGPTTSDKTAGATLGSTSDAQSSGVAQVGQAVPNAIQPPAAPMPTPKTSRSASIDRIGTPMPAAVGAPPATAPGTAMLPAAPVDDASGTAAAQAPTVASTVSGAAPTATRPNFKTTIAHSGSVPNAVGDSDDGNDAPSAAPNATSAAPSAATSTADAASPAPPSDVSTAAALAALASSRSAYSAAATDTSDESSDAVTSASAVASAPLTDAAMKGSAAASAAAVQTALLQGVARADKHSPGTVDAAGATAAGTAAPIGGSDATAGLSQLVAGVPTAPDAAPTPTVRIAANVDSAQFPQELSARVSWMVDNNLNGAKLQVNPPALGPIELRILVSGDHAQVWMSSHSAVTRDALENSTPKLREMLSTQGFSQVSVDISQRSFQERSGYAQPYDEPATSGRRMAAGVPAVTGATATRHSPGIVDAYA